jgi:uncharacterized protein (TIGR00730 family)
VNQSPVERAGEPLGIAVFGSSEPRDGAREYARAQEVGRRLALEGFPVISGGYGGVMEAASRGAREAGGQAVGVVCSVFSERTPNPFLTETVRTHDLFERTRELVQRARGFVVLPGNAGTLAELTFLWALDRAGCLAGRPVVLLGRRWSGWLEDLARRRMLDRAQLSRTHVTPTPREAVRRLRSCLSHPPTR